MNQTNNYYQENADTFIQATLEIDMDSMYEKFIPLLPEGGKILDAGCGSGRDSLYFKNKCFNITAIDSCQEFVKFTSEYAGVEAFCIPFICAGVRNGRYSRVQYMDEHPAFSMIFRALTASIPAFLPSFSKEIFFPFCCAS